MRRWPAVAAVIIVIGVTLPADAQVPNTLLRELAEEDQSARSAEKPEKVDRSDAERIELVLRELAYGRVRTPEDKANAALILDHSPMSFRDGELVALSPDNYLLGHYLALSAFGSGLKRAGYLAAATLDRYLSMTTGCQKYGTNRFINQKTGQEELSPIDRHTTDEERARFGVPPLATLLKQFPEQNRRCESSARD
jgi:hypothetical protein